MQAKPRMIILGTQGGSAQSAWQWNRNKLGAYLVQSEARHESNQWAASIRHLKWKSSATSSRQIWPEMITSRDAEILVLKAQGRHEMDASGWVKSAALASENLCFKNRSQLAFFAICASAMGQKGQTWGNCSEPNVSKSGVLNTACIIECTLGQPKAIIEPPEKTYTNKPKLPWTIYDLTWTIY